LDGDRERLGSRLLGDVEIAETLGRPRSQERPHLDLPVAGLRPLGGELERHVEAGGPDGPEAREVLVVRGAGGLWPYGWNQPVV
jgi:hypothetical protein